MKKEANGHGNSKNQKSCSNENKSLYMQLTFISYLFLKKIQSSQKLGLYILQLRNLLI